MIVRSMPKLEANQLSDWVRGHHSNTVLRFDDLEQAGTLILFNDDLTLTFPTHELLQVMLLNG